MQRLIERLLASTALREEPDAGGGGGGGNTATDPKPPEGLDASYWDPTAKAVAVDKLVPDFIKRTGELKELTDAREARAKDIPAEAKDYDIGLPDDFEKPEGFDFKLEGGEAEVLRETAKELNLTRAETKKLVAALAKATIKENEALNARVAEEMKKLGTQGQQRKDALATWAEGALGKDKAKVFLRGIISAEQFEVAEQVMKLAKGSTAAGFNGNGRNDGGPTGPSDEEWAKMSESDRINYARKNPSKAAA